MHSGIRQMFHTLPVRGKGFPDAWRTYASVLPPQLCVRRNPGNTRMHWFRYQRAVISSGHKTVDWFGIKIDKHRASSLSSVTQKRMDLCHLSTNHSSVQTINLHSQSLMPPQDNKSLDIHKLERKRKHNLQKRKGTRETESARLKIYLYCHLRLTLEAKKSHARAHTSWKVHSLPALSHKFIGIWVDDIQNCYSHFKNP